MKFMSVCSLRLVILLSVTRSLLVVVGDKTRLPAEDRDITSISHALSSLTDDPTVSPVRSRFTI
jgi:hypothetical protein